MIIDEVSNGIRKTMDQLTPRECQVAMLVARGLSNKQVAHQLGISEGTVKIHVHKIMEKLGVNRRYAVITMAMTHPFVPEAMTPAQ